MKSESKQTELSNTIQGHEQKITIKKDKIKDLSSDLSSKNIEIERIKATNEHL